MPTGDPVAPQLSSLASHKPQLNQDNRKCSPPPTSSLRPGRGSIHRLNQVSILHPLRQHETSKANTIQPPADPLQSPVSQHTPMEDSEDDDKFIEVKSNKKSATIRSPLDEKKNRFGILLSRVAAKPILQNQGFDIGAIFNAILCLDAEAIFLPHDDDTHHAVKLSTMIKPTYDFKAMIDFKITNWGRPSNNKGKLSMSFYIALDILQPDVKAICHDPTIQHILKLHKMTLYPHNLLQLDSKPVAFFSGKSVAHTWHNNLKQRFGCYLTENLNDSNTMSNLFGEDHEVPTNIPFHFRVITLRSK